MTDEAIRKAVLEAIGEIAPEVETSKIQPDVPLREQLDIDSFDFLRILTLLEERLGVAVPESDYRQLATLSTTVAYLSAHGHRDKPNANRRQIGTIPESSK